MTANVAKNDEKKTAWESIQKDSRIKMRNTL